MTESTRKLFGTDGIRAVAGETPLDPTTIFAVGLALAHSLCKVEAQPKVLLGRDTRESSPSIWPSSPRGPKCSASISWVPTWTKSS